MAARSIFLALTRNRRRETNPLTSQFSSIASGGAVVRQDSHDFQHQPLQDDDLKSRIFSLTLPKRSATNVLQKWIREGNQISISELRRISKDLRKSHRFKHALEISEWMISHDEFEVSDSDYAIRIDLMTKVFGIDAAERYFEGLPSTAKTTETYTALLHSYAVLKLTEKAEKLYEKIKQSNLCFSALTYNELMTLYMSVGQVEKVSNVVEDLKGLKISPDLFTYNVWISSCAASLNIDEVQQILNEMSSGESASDERWVRYVKLAKIYIDCGHVVNSNSNSLEVESEKGMITQREWITYDFLIILYGGLGHKDKVDQIWKSLGMTKQKMMSRNYVCAISSYLILGYLDEVCDVIEQWKQSANTDFDVSICDRVAKAFGEVGLSEKAEIFGKILKKECEVVYE
jgi:pentatricopeptide repeat protein